MPSATDDFSARWQSLNDVERKFLFATYQIDQRLPHCFELSRILPPISWRTVGLMSGVKLDEVDELVRKLADLRLLRITNPELREMGLICGGHLRRMIDVRRRRQWNWATLIAGLVAGPGTLLWLRLK
jgi:hypothetical protein